MAVAHLSRIDIYFDVEHASKCGTNEEGSSADDTEGPPSPTPFPNPS